MGYLDNKQALAEKQAQLNEYAAIGKQSVEAAQQQELLNALQEAQYQGLQEGLASQFVPPELGIPSMGTGSSLDEMAIRSEQSGIPPFEYPNAEPRAGLSEYYYNKHMPAQRTSVMGIRG